jgi:hypothetical protein
MKRVYITPETAAKMLAKNVGNRSPRMSTVRFYAAEMKAGRWQETHQALAVDCDGNLVDGQHRLLAVVASGTSHWFWLDQYAKTHEAMHLPIDTQARRSHADIMRAPKLEVQTASTLLRELLAFRYVASPEILRGVYEHLYDAIHPVCEASRTKNPRSSATVRAAVALRVATLNKAGRQADAVETVSQLRDFILLDNIHESWPMVAQFLKQLSTESKHRLLDSDRFVRAWRAFDIDGRNQGKLQIKDKAAVLKEMTQVAKSLGVVDLVASENND